MKKFVASMSSGIPISTPVFDGARESEIKSLLDNAGFAEQRPDDNSSMAVQVNRSIRGSRLESSI